MAGSPSTLALREGSLCARAGLSSSVLVTRTGTRQGRCRGSSTITGIVLCTSLSEHHSSPGATAKITGARPKFDFNRTKSFEVFRPDCQVKAVDPNPKALKVGRSWGNPRARRPGAHEDKTSGAAAVFTPEPFQTTGLGRCRPGPVRHTRPAALALCGHSGTNWTQPSVCFVGNVFLLHLT